MKYKDVIETIIADMEVDSDAGKKKAYLKCIDYADEHFARTFDINPFLSEAASILGQPRIGQEVIYDMTEFDGSEKCNLEYVESSGPTLTANESGLLFLANLFSNLARSQMEGEHVHLWSNTHPMVGNTFPLTIYLEGDDWFEQNYEARAGDEDDKSGIAERDIAPDEIAGLVLTTPAPPMLSLTPMRFYEIRSIKKYEDEKEWSKPIRDSVDRMYLVTFLDDSRQEISFAFDLDDNDILPVTSLDVRGPR